jgi:ribosomal protein S18 acetylase RimI-like enzyme
VNSVKALIRRATVSDIDAMVDLLRLLFSIEEDFTFDESRHRLGLAVMLKNENERCIMVAELETVIAGMCSVQLLVSTAEGGLAALIEDLVVDEKYHSQKIGSTLLSAVESWALSKGAKRLELLADRNNARALEFYKKRGWRRTQLICLHKK